MGERVPQSQEELEGHLRDQLYFLKSSCESFDEGYQGEAKRLANAIRILVHDTRHSTSLLGQLGLKDRHFYDTADPWDPRNLLTHQGLVAMRLSLGGGSADAAYDATLDEGLNKRMVPFEDWWDRIVFVDDDRNKLTREDLVLTVANQDGGAHVDPALDEVYTKLTRENSMGWTFKAGSVERPMESPHFAAVRQVAHEVIRTVEDPPTAEEGVEFEDVGRNDPCPCQSGAKFKKCCGSPG